jgi:phosphotransferase system HPr (HPr) family protein
VGAASGVILEREVVIRNREGLHFRPIMQIVETAAKFGAQVRMQCNEKSADARSVFELMMLTATRGAKLRVVAEGDDAAAALDALIRLIESGFGES